MDASRRSSHGNAYFTGLGKNKRVVFFDTLLKTLNDRELLAILAHELGHMKLKHILKGMLLSLTLSFVAFFILGLVAKQNWFYTGHFLRVISPGALLFIFMEAFSIYTFWLTPLSSIFSRKNEYEADAYAAQMTNPEDLIQGLVKLYRDNAGTVINDSWYSGFYHSHPPALQRIQKLESFKSLPREALP
jgi:STE24 endopeptidase